MDVPAPWREYLIAVRRTLFITDPMERCLAFPDLPGNRWPEGHAAAHCRRVLEAPISLDEAEALLAESGPQGLEALVEGYRQRHSAVNDQSEIVHRFFARFDEGEQAVRVAEAWLAALPDSPHANVAKAGTLRQAGWAERGNSYAHRVPAGGFQRMRALMDEAIPYYRKAISIDPTLGDAYLGLMDIGTVDSRDELEQWAFEQALAIDPACPAVAESRMRALSPRWGGSMEAMLAFANTLEPYAAGRPLLANWIAAPYLDVGMRLIDNKEFNQHARDVLDVAIRTGSNRKALRDAGQIAVHRSDGGAVDPMRGAAIYLQLSRFQKIGSYERTIIAQSLIDEPEWAANLLLEAPLSGSLQARGNYILAMALRHSGMLDAAHPRYLQAMFHDEFREGALFELSTMWLTAEHLTPAEAAERAAPYVDRLFKEYPHNGLAHLIRMQLVDLRGGSIERSDLEAFLEVADEQDPLQQDAIEEVRAFISR